MQFFSFITIALTGMLFLGCNQTDTQEEARDAVLLLSGSLSEEGGKIVNNENNISISVAKEALTKSYKLSYYGKIDKSGQMSLWLESFPPMGREEMAKLRLKEPTLRVLRERYLQTDQNSKQNSAMKRSPNAAYGTLEHDYSPYSDAGIAKECRPAVENGELNEMVWRDYNEDGYYLPYVWQGTIAAFNYNALDFKEKGQSGGIPRLQPDKVVRGGLRVRCASALRSHVAKEDSTLKNRRAVLLIHGFERSGFLGGYKLDGDKIGGEYFASFQRMLDGYEVNGEKLIPFVFQWRTNARFEDVATELGEALAMLKEKTGKKVHIVAHSFGGVLTRTLIQGLATNAAFDKTFAQAQIASITTIGTPHSGLFVSKKTVNFNDEGDVTFPAGRHGLAGAGISFCSAITCFQAGAHTFLNEDLYGTKEKAGYITYELFQQLDNYPDIPTQVLIGLKPESRKVKKEADGLYSVTYDFLRNTALLNPGAGDELLSIFGQRFIPNADKIHLSEAYNDGVIEEHLLHMDTFSNAETPFVREKDDRLFSLYRGGFGRDWQVDDYAVDVRAEDLQKYMFGYNHRTGQYNESYKQETIEGEESNVTQNSEVGLQSCEDAASCGHPTWNFFISFLEKNSI